MRDEDDDSSSPSQPPHSLLYAHVLVKYFLFHGPAVVSHHLSPSCLRRKVQGVQYCTGEG